MKKYFKRIAALFLILFLMLPMSANVFGRTADDIKKEMDGLAIEAEKKKKESQEIQVQISIVQGDVNELNYLKSLVEQAIRAVQGRIDALNAIISLQWEAIHAKQADIAELENHILLTEMQVLLREAKIENLEAENEENKRKFAQMVKTNYMTGNYGYMEMIMESNDFFDLVSRAEVLRKAGDRYDEFMQDLLSAIKEQEYEIENLEETKKQLDRDKIICENEKADLEEELAQLHLAMDELDNEMETEREKLFGYASDIQELQTEITGMYRQYNATVAEIEALNHQTEALIKELQNINRPDYSKDGFRWPLDYKFRLLTCDYGYDAWRGGQHIGIDIGNSGINGANIYSVQAGTVIFAGWNGGYGNCIIVDHGGGVSTLYAHMSSMKAGVGDEVVQGDVLGYVGNTGWSTGPHLHFEVRENGKAVNPWNYVS